MKVWKASSTALVWLGRVMLPSWSVVVCGPVRLAVILGLGELREDVSSPHTPRMRHGRAHTCARTRIVFGSQWLPVYWYARPTCYGFRCLSVMFTTTLSREPTTVKGWATVYNCTQPRPCVCVAVPCSLAALGGPVVLLLLRTRSILYLHTSCRAA